MAKTPAKKSISKKPAAKKAVSKAAPKAAVKKDASKKTAKPAASKKATPARPKAKAAKRVLKKAVQHRKGDDNSSSVVVSNIQNMRAIGNDNSKTIDLYVSTFDSTANTPTVDVVHFYDLANKPLSGSYKGLSLGSDAAKDTYQNTIFEYSTDGSTKNSLDLSQDSSQNNGIISGNNGQNQFTVGNLIYIRITDQGSVVLGFASLEPMATCSPNDNPNGN